MHFSFVNYKDTDISILSAPDDIQVNAQIIKWTCSSAIYGIVHYHLFGSQGENLALASHQYRAWSDLTDLLAGPALYWW